MRYTIDPGIEYAPSFAEWEAAVAAGLDLWQWETGQYPVWFRARVLAWHRLHGLVRLHTQDAVERKARRRQQK